MHATLSITGQPKHPAGSADRTTPRLRLEVLDGIRGLAALYVALFHAMGYTGHNTTAQTQTTGIMRFVAAALD